MRKVGIVIVALLLLGAGWSALWLWGAREAGRQLDGWLAAEAAQGRTWTCPNRTVGGYPLALTIACDDPTFSGEAMGQGVSAQLAHLQASLAVWHPRRVALSLTPPFAYRTSDSTVNLGGTWSKLDLALDGLPNPSALSLDGDKIAVAGTFGDQGRQSGSAVHLETRLTLPAEAADPTLGFAIALSGAPIAALDEIVGDRAPTEVALTGTLDKADVGDARTPAEAIDHWRTSGGQLTLASGAIAREGAKVLGAGTLALDAQHRPTGRIDAQFIGLEPILKRYGISGNLAAAGSLLSALFGGARPAAPAQPGALSLPISLRDGRVAIGPIDTGAVLAPLY